jgi:superfamily II DNA or RNA helicase
MGLKDLDLKAFYDSDTDDILQDFYIPVLSESRHYERLAGFFTSNSLAMAARGIYRFILNGGTMDLIVGADLQKDDVDAIRKGQLTPHQVVEESGLKEIRDLTEPFILKHVKALAWLVAKERLRIRVAIPLDEQGLPMDSMRIEQEGIFHHKIGVLSDENGNVVSFNGSINETARAWTKNRESFHVFKSWQSQDTDHISGDRNALEKYLVGNPERTLVMDVPESLKAALVRIAPNSIEDLKLEDYEQRASVHLLRDYQRSAMDSWLFDSLGNPRRQGILEMATGTGKTWVAIACLQRIDRDSKDTPLMSIIAVPFKHLITQWKAELAKWNYDSPVELHGGVKDWKQRLSELSLDMRLGHKKRAIILTTHDTLASDRFKSVMQKNTFPILVVVDEVHAIGSELRRESLLDNYTYRMGLSATPERYFDDIGTASLLEYFGGVVFSLPIKTAIGRGFLVPYRYFPNVVELEDDEMRRYLELTRKYASLASTQEIDTEKLEKFLFERAKVVESAKEKYGALTKILSELKTIDRCFIFVTERQIAEVNRILDGMNLIHHDFTYKESRDERENLLARFARGDYQVLVAIRCLDEGVDVPSARQAIIMASTGNPRQFIQRRGRVLRTDRASSKTSADIWDFVVVPSLRPDSSSDYFRIERKILERQLKRVKEFAESSTNPYDSTLVLTDIKLAYRIE